MVVKEEQRSILIVDDESAMRNVLYEALRKEGYGVVTAVSGPDALSEFSNEEFDVVILDVLMPGMNGVEVLKKMKASYPDSIVIILSGVADEDGSVQAEAKSNGAFAFLNKPCKLEVLKATIEKACA